MFGANYVFIYFNTTILAYVMFNSATTCSTVGTWFKTTIQNPILRQMYCRLHWAKHTAVHDDFP